ncbi:MAG: copper transporter [Coriobacteriia bacterium]
MYNLRYHIASLVAVFLALAVGLLLGSVVAERGMITEQTASLIEDLERRFDSISATNDELSLGFERDHAFAQAAVEPLVRGKLEARNVVVLVGTGRVDGVTAVEDVVSQAGGNAITASILTPGLGLDTTEPEGLAGYFELRGVEMAEPGQDLQEQVAEALVREWRSAEPRELTALLIGAGLLDQAGMEGTATVDAVVIVGNSEAGCDPFALEVARAITAAGGTAAGVDSMPVEGGVPAICSAGGLSALDHVATPQGMVSLAWVLSGRASGYYGFGDAAVGQHPPLDD